MITTEQLARIKQLHSLGHGNREIARELGVHHNTIAYHLSKLGLGCNTANEPIDMVSDSEARCRKCGDVKSINEFQFGRKGQKYEYRFSYCNECRKKQSYLNLNNDVEKFLADRFNRLNQRCRKRSIPCSITKEEFLQQYHRQNGLCFYTDEKMICQVGRKSWRNSLSIDRIIPERGYVIGNVVFATNRINSCKQDLSLYEMEKWMPNWYDRIVEFWRSIG